MFIIFYEPTLLLHPGDATIREKEKKNNVCILVRAMDRKQTQMSWLRWGGGSLREAGYGELWTGPPTRCSLAKMATSDLRFE